MYDSIKKSLINVLDSKFFYRYQGDPFNSEVSILEREFAELLGVKHCLAVSSCTNALFLSLKSLDLPKYSKVVIPAFTFVAVPSSIVQAGNIPVLCEINEDLVLDIDCLLSLFDSNNDISAIMVSHMRGYISNLDEIKNIARSKKIPVIEDAAHSLLSTWNNQYTGTLTDIGCFSTQSYKLLNSGEGGLLVTNDSDIFAKAVIMSGAYERLGISHGAASNFIEKYLGRFPIFNVRMSNLTAAVIRPQLKFLNETANYYTNIYNKLKSDLSDLNLIKFPSTLPESNRVPDSVQIIFNSLVPLHKIQNFINEINKLGVPASLFGSEDNARAYWNWKFLEEIPDLPKTRKILCRTIDFRLSNNLSEKDYINLVSNIRSIYFRNIV